MDTILQEDSKWGNTENVSKLKEELTNAVNELCDIIMQKLNMMLMGVPEAMVKGAGLKKCIKWNNE